MNLLNKLFQDRNIKTPVCFFDETGRLNNPIDRFFILGMVKSLRPHKLNNFIKKIRDKNHFYDEIKWNKVNKRNLDIMKIIIDNFFSTYNTNFYCIVLQKDEMNFEKYFNNDFFKAYKSFTVLLLNRYIKKDEIVSVVADHCPAPEKDEFEAKVRNYVNDHNKALSIHSVIRIHSKGSNLIQIADLLMGAVNYEFKLKNNLIKNPSKAKIDLLDYLKSKLSINDLSIGIDLAKFNIMIFTSKAKKNLQAMDPTVNA